MATTGPDLKKYVMLVGLWGMRACKDNVYVFCLLSGSGCVVSSTVGVCFNWPQRILRYVLRQYGALFQVPRQAPFGYAISNSTLMSFGQLVLASLLRWGCVADHVGEGSCATNPSICLPVRISMLKGVYTLVSSTHPFGLVPLSWPLSCIHTWVYVCIYVCMYVCMFVCMYVCVYVRMRLYSVKLNGNRRVTGVLRGFDQFMNLVLEECVEEVSDKERNSLGMVVRTDWLSSCLTLTIDELPPSSCSVRLIFLFASSALKSVYWSISPGHSWQFCCNHGSLGAAVICDGSPSWRTRGNPNV
jgi:hypothetical protein